MDQAETALGMDMRLSKSTKKSTEDKIVRRYCVTRRLHKLDPTNRMSRELNKVFTNGTLVDPELITDEQAGHCVCIRENADECEDKSTFGICVLDCSTSQFDLSAFEDDICRTKLETMMRQLRPKEIVYRKVCSVAFSVYVLALIGGKGVVERVDDAIVESGFTCLMYMDWSSIR